MRLKLILCVVLIAVWLLCAALVVRAADPALSMPPADPVKEVITLDAPKSVLSGSGYLKIHAEAAGLVSFDVEAQFDDETVAFQYEQLDADTLLVGIPASAGVIRVEAATAVDGKAPVFAKAFIAVVAPPKKEPPPPSTPAVGKLFAIVVIDRTAASAAGTLADSPTLLKSIKALGDDRSVLDAKSPAIAAQGLTKYVADAGGPPCLILMDAAGDVHKAVKLPADEASVLALIKDAHAGK